MARVAVSVDEAPWILEANGRRVAAGTFTPCEPESLGVGRLIAEGYIAGSDDLHFIESVTLPPGVTLIRAQLLPLRALEAEQERKHRIEAGCGLLHFVACEPHALRRRRSLAVPKLDAFRDLFHDLFRVTDERHPGGGMHAAALCDGSRLLLQSEDVGRHNAVDRVIGKAWLDGQQAGDLGLILSARVSGQIALSAARSGVAWIASRSVPTTLAVAIGEAAGMPIVGRAAGPHATRFAGGIES